jgi:hypothetical protein
MPEHDGASGKEASADLSGEGLADKPFQLAGEDSPDEDWEEESVPLAGEINSVNTLITGDHFGNGVQAAQDNSKDELTLQDDDPFDPYRTEEVKKDNGLHKTISDSYTEFGGELSPAQSVHPGLAGRGDELYRDTEKYREHRTVEGEQDGPRSKAFGWVAIILAIASLFYWPAVLGPTAAVVGVVAYNRGNKALGIWSVTLGLVSLLAYLYWVPYFS